MGLSIIMGNNHYKNNLLQLPRVPQYFEFTKFYFSYKHSLAKTYKYACVGYFYNVS